MKKYWNITPQFIFTKIGNWLGWFLGGYDGPLCTLIVFVSIDYVTEVMCAIIDKRPSTEIGFKGIFKKILIFALVGIGNILDVQVIGNGSIFRTAVIFFYLSNVGVSLLENANYLGLPIPEMLHDVLEQLRDKKQKGNNN